MRAGHAMEQGLWLLVTVLSFIVIYTLLKNYIGGPNVLGAIPCITDKDGAWTIGFVKNVMSPSSVGNLVGSLPHCKADASGRTTDCTEKHGSMHTQAITCTIASGNDYLGKSKSISYVADPFLVIPPPGGRSLGTSSYFKLGIVDDIQKNGESQLLFSFYEMKSAERSKGEIGTAVSFDMGDNWRHLGTAFTSVEHLSYPFVVFNRFGGDGIEDGEYIMLPQSNPIVGSYDGALGAQRALVTKPSDFPFGWKVVSTKLSGKKFADASPIFWKGRWYIWITSILHGPTRYFLELYTCESKDLARSRWVEHPASPITTNMTIARMGGRPIITDDGLLLRPAQDCSKAYGRQVLWVHVEKLSPTEYKESVRSDFPAVTSLWPPPEDSTSPYSKLLKTKPRIHHVDLQRHPSLSASKSWIGLVDGEHFALQIPRDIAGDSGSAITDSAKVFASGYAANPTSEYFLGTGALCLTVMLIMALYALRSIIAVINSELVEYFTILHRKKSDSPNTEEELLLPTMGGNGSRNPKGLVTRTVESVMKLMTVVLFDAEPLYRVVRDLHVPIIVKKVLGYTLTLVEVGTTYLVSIGTAVVIIRLLTWDVLPGFPMVDFAFRDNPAHHWSPKNNSRETPELGQPQDYRMNLDILTAASADYYPRIVNLIGSLHTFESQDDDGADGQPHKVHVYDLGFTYAQRLELACMKNVVLHDFNITQYPKHVQVLSNYAWKIIILSNHLGDLSKKMLSENRITMDKKAAVLWVDGGLEARAPFVEETKAAMSYFGHSCAFVGPLTGADLNGAPSVNKGLQIDRDLHYKGMLWSAGGFQGFVENSPGHNLILKPALNCALQEDCISKAFSYDQGAFTRLIHRYGFSCQPRDKYMARLGWKFMQNPLFPNDERVAARRARLPLQYSKHLQFNKTCDVVPGPYPHHIVEKKVLERIHGEKGAVFMKRDDFIHNVEESSNIYWLGLFSCLEFTVLFLGMLCLIDYYKDVHHKNKNRQERGTTPVKFQRNNHNSYGNIQRGQQLPRRPGWHLHRVLLVVYLAYLAGIIYTGELLFALESFRDMKSMLGYDSE